MKKLLRSDLVSISLAIFSMLFGAGNLMYPIKVGITTGIRNGWGMFGFLLTAVLLPVFGLVSMILFDGDFEKFFARLGKIPGKIIIYCCMLVIGPAIAIPRIVTLSHTMMAPFLPGMSALIFTLLFLGVTFLCTFRENQIVELLGKIISPALLASLVIIIFKGFIFPGTAAIDFGLTRLEAFTTNLIRGYETLDLLGGLFFASIILIILKNKFSEEHHQHPKKLASIGLRAGLIGTSLLALVYIGLSYLGVHHGLGLESVNLGELFREISFRVLGSYGAAIVGTAVLMACLSTSIALSAVITEFFIEESKHKLKFVPTLAVVLLSCVPLSIHGLDAVLRLTGGPITFIGYPILIAITIFNIGYKLFGFKPIKLPVAVTGIIASLLYFLR